jgi:hypothetical protein
MLQRKKYKPSAMNSQKVSLGGTERSKSSPKAPSAEAASYTERHGLTQPVNCQTVNCQNGKAGRLAPDPPTASNGQLQA